MMDNLRVATNHIVIKIILGLIILSFLLTGIGSYLTSGVSGYAAKVDGQEISLNQLEQVVQNERNRLQEELGDRFATLASNEGYMQSLRQQALSRLIDDMLLEQYAKKLDLVISDEQVKIAIRKTPYFHINEQFDNNKYLNTLSQFGISPDNYAQLVRQQLLSQQLIQAYTATAFTLPSEIDALEALAMQQRHIRLATLNVNARITPQPVTEEEIRIYYRQHSQSFVAPEKVKVSYIEIDAAALENKVAVTDEEISDYYEKNRSNYTQTERKDYSVIQVKTEQEAKTILETLKQGGDFAQLAQEQSTDMISRKKGGELGWLEASTTPEEILQAKLTQEGELSGIVKSNVGYLIIRLNKIQPEQMQPLSAVQNRIASQLKQQKTLDDYFALQRKVSEAATNNNDSLIEAEAVAGIKAVETPWFTRDTVPKVLDFKPVIQAIFDHHLVGEQGMSESNSDVIPATEDRAFVIRITGYQPEKVNPLDQVRSQVVENVQRQKALQQVNTEGEQLLTALQQGKGDEALKKAGIQFGEEQILTRSSDDPKLVDTVFSLPQPQENQSVYGRTQDHQDNIVLIQLDSVKQGVLNSEERIAFSAQMLTTVTGITLDALLTDLRTKANIKLGINN